MVTVVSSFRRVLSRPRPWILRYLLVTLPALVVSLLLLLPLRPWFKTPLLVKAFRTQSLDYLLEAVEATGGQIAGGPVLAVGLLLAPISWLVVRALWVFFEGGIVATYARPERPTWREFFAASRRWFGSFLLLGVMWLLVTLLLAVIVGLVGVLARALWAPLGTLFFVGGGVAGMLLWMWFSVARSTAVVRRDRHVVRALGGAAHVIRRHPATVLAVFVGALALQVLLALVLRAATSAVPFSWWFLALLLQQVVTLVGIGVTLARRAGEVALATHVFPDEVEAGLGAPEEFAPEPEYG